jgi:hypothetical protein
MAKHVQRKRFDHPELAQLAADGFKPDLTGPGVTVTAETREIDGQYWVYVTQEGPLTDYAEPLLLPEYERVG